MRRAITILVSVGLLAGALALPADAAKKKKPKIKVPQKVERVVEIAYAEPGIGATVLGRGGGYPVGFPNSQEIPIMAEERYMKIEVIDESGHAVAGYISQGDVNGNGLNDDLYGDFCGAHAQPLELAAPGSPIVGVYAFNGTCPDGTPSIMTSGTIKITLSNMP